MFKLPMNAVPTFGCTRCNSGLFDNPIKWPKIDIDKQKARRFFKKNFKRIQDGICRKSSKVTNKLCGGCENQCYNDERSCNSDMDINTYYDRITYVKPTSRNQYYEEQSFEPYYEEDDDDFYHRRHESNDDEDCCTYSGLNYFQHQDHYYGGSVFT